MGHLEGDEVVGYRPRAGAGFLEAGVVKEEAEVEAIMDHAKADAVEHAVEEEGSRLEWLKSTGIIHPTLMLFYYMHANNSVAQFRRWRHPFSRCRCYAGGRCTRHRQTGSRAPELEDLDACEARVWHQGATVTLWANYVQIIAAPDLALYRYALSVSPNATGRKLTQIIRLLLEAPELTGLRPLP